MPGQAHLPASAPAQLCSDLGLCVLCRGRAPGGPFPAPGLGLCGGRGMSLWRDTCKLAGSVLSRGSGRASGAHSPCSRGVHCGKEQGRRAWTSAGGATVALVQAPGTDVHAEGLRPLPRFSPRTSRGLGLASRASPSSEVVVDPVSPPQHFAFLSGLIPADPRLEPSRNEIILFSKTEAEILESSLIGQT